MYGIAPGNVQSDGENDSEDTLPSSALNAPIEALQGLANVAVEAALSSRYVGAYILRASRLFKLQQGAQGC